MDLAIIQPDGSRTAVKYDSLECSKRVEDIVAVVTEVVSTRMEIISILQKQYNLNSKKPIPHGMPSGVKPCYEFNLAYH